MENHQFQAIRKSPLQLSWRWPTVVLDFPPALPYVVGILNITPDSFSDGGSYGSVDAAVARALAMVEEGASVIDIGGQSTRPGFVPVSLEEEGDRVFPVLAALREILGDWRDGRRETLVSLDTDKPALADRMFSLGLADILNDESGGDTAMAAAAARHNAPLILMHRPALSGRGGMQAVKEDLIAIRRSYSEAGLSEDYIALDPGLGFGKDNDLDVLSNCGELLEPGSPLYIGASRKRVIGKYSGNPESGSRLGGSIAAALWAARAGAAFIRVHDVKETVEALKMDAALQRAVRQSR